MQDGSKGFTFLIRLASNLKPVITIFYTFEVLWQVEPPQPEYRIRLDELKPECIETNAHIARYLAPFVERDRVAVHRVTWYFESLDVFVITGWKDVTKELMMLNLRQRTAEKEKDTVNFVNSLLRRSAGPPQSGARRSGVRGPRSGGRRAARHRENDADQGHVT